MDVTFTRTGPRRYGVRADRSRYPAVEMDPAPGYDPLLPHDLIHFVIEDELGLTRGVFGQLAAGGDAGTFRLPAAQEGSRERTRTQRRVARRGRTVGREGRDDAALSEEAASICHYEWLRRSDSAVLREEARTMARYVATLRSRPSGTLRGLLTDEVIDRICNRLDQLSARWCRLREGESLTLPWHAGERRAD